MLYYKSGLFLFPVCGNSHVHHTARTALYCCSNRSTLERARKPSPLCRERERGGVRRSRLRSSQSSRFGGEKDRDRWIYLASIWQTCLEEVSSTCVHSCTCVDEFTYYIPFIIMQAIRIILEIVDLIRGLIICHLRPVDLPRSHLSKAAGCGCQFGAQMWTYRWPPLIGFIISCSPCLCMMPLSPLP